MLILPAIDLYQGKAVRLFKGDYSQMTVYSSHPVSVAEDMKKCGAKQIHLVDLEGAKSGETPNMSTMIAIKEATGLFCEVGGGIRNMATVDKYIGAGIDRVILGTAAVNDRDFVMAAAKKYGDKIAVGIDVRNGRVAIKGWTENTDYTAKEFCLAMKSLGITVFICTDISCDGAMKGTNRAFFRELSNIDGIKIIASGGVSSLDDVSHLAASGLYAAIIGKAYYTGDINLEKAIGIAN